MLSVSKVHMFQMLALADSTHLQGCGVFGMLRSDGGYGLMGGEL